MNSTVVKPILTDDEKITAKVDAMLKQDREELEVLKQEFSDKMAAAGFGGKNDIQNNLRRIKKCNI